MLKLFGLSKFSRRFLCLLDNAVLKSIFLFYGAQYNARKKSEKAREIHDHLQVTPPSWTAGQESGSSRVSPLFNSG